jgi:pimeloyl-ACP methyl ester carboxylesterase
MASIAPALRHSADNPEGVDPKVFEGIKQAIEADRFAFLETFLNNFYNKKLLFNTRISDAAIHANFNVGSASSYHAMLNCVDAWLEDFRADIAQIKIPALVIHGDSDQILPIDATGKRAAALIPGAQLHVIEGGPHGLNWTHATEVNKALLEFIAK